MLILSGWRPTFAYRIGRLRLPTHGAVVYWTEIRNLRPVAGARISPNHRVAPAGRPFSSLGGFPKAQPTATRIAARVVGGRLIPHAERARAIQQATTTPENPRAFVGTKPADEVLDSIARYYTRIGRITTRDEQRPERGAGPRSG
jgi:hypothetical protein